MSKEGPNPSGLCQCGCGRPAPIASRVDNRHGHVKGQPVRFCRGHATRKPDPNPSGRCGCGCGGLTRVTSSGCHRRFIQGHQGIKPGVPYTIDERTGCWVWQRATNKGGYGLTSVGGSICLAHRRAYEQAYGPIPEGLLVCHTCDNPPCVNPAHLFVGTDKDNAADRDAKGRTQRYNAKKTHCPRGHEYSPENTIVRRGRRSCRTCANEHQRALRAKRREEKHAY